MRWSRKEVVSPTLLLSAEGVLVEATKQPMFPPNGKRIGQYEEEVPPPQGAAVVAVQFVHTVGEGFVGLQVFKIHYTHRAPGRDLYEEYLGAPFDTIGMAATPAGSDALNANQKRVLATLLSGSDPKAWEASAAFRSELEGR